MRRTVLALAAAVASGSSYLTLSKFDLATYPTAVCNDGTPSGYYYRSSPSGTSDVWIVHQQGGFWCYDASSCAARSKALTSSSGWAPNMTVDGLLASSDPRLADAHIVYVPYCTSDAYVGNVGAAHVPFGFHFRGRDVVTALLTELVVTRHLGSAPNTQVLYSGCSAGARGVLFNHQFVHDWLGQHAPHVQRFGALLDSSLWLDIDPLATGVVSVRQQVQQVYTLVNASGSISPACAAVYPPASADAWKCLFPEYATPLITVPYLLFAFSYDAWQLSWNENVPVPTTSPQLAYAATFHGNLIATATNDTITPAKPDTAAMVAACYRHCNTETTLFQTLLVNGVSLDSAVASWFFKDGSVPAYLVDTCTGFNCGPGCPAP